MIVLIMIPMTNQKIVYIYTIFSSKTNFKPFFPSLKNLNSKIFFLFPSKKILNSKAIEIIQYNYRGVQRRENEKKDVIVGQLICEKHKKLFEKFSRHFRLSYFLGLHR